MALTNLNQGAPSGRNATPATMPGECTGGANGLNEDDLHRAYESQVDPRLNYQQALELAFLIARKMKSESM